MRASKAMSKHQRALAELHVLNSRAEAAFRRGLADLNGRRDCESIVGKITARLKAMVDTPQRSWWPPLELPQEANVLMTSIGFLKTAVGYEYVGPKTPATMACLEIAARALELFRPEYDAAAASGEPELGAAGTVSVVAVRHNVRKRRRFWASDSLETVLMWLRHHAFEDDHIRLSDLCATAPPRHLESSDQKRTLQALGFWPGVELQLKSKALSPERRISMPGTKPSDILKAITTRFDTQDGPAANKPPRTHLKVATYGKKAGLHSKDRLVPAPA